MNNEQRTIAFYTLGCKLNFSETSTLARTFVNSGFKVVPAAHAADVYLINTCSVTESADKKCRQSIRKFIKQSPAAIIVVTGCYAQLKPDAIAAIEGVDLVIGADMKGNVVELVNNIREKGNARVFSCEINEVDSFFQAFSSGDRTRSFLKVQDGCDYKCSYCTIPMARGKSRNIPIADILQEAEQIAASGIKEVVLTGVNIGDFGKTTNESFFELVKALDKVEGIERYRISSIEPNLLTDELIEYVSQSDKFLPHFHIPLQSGTNRILGLMRRRYKREIFASRLEYIRKLMPEAFIGVDVIVGFPGETDEDFNDTYTFLEGLAPSYLHIFPYSERPNTPTVAMEGKVSPVVINGRINRLNELCKQLHTNFYQSSLGKIAKVLLESSKHGSMMHGFSENYIKVEVPYQKNLSNIVVSVKLTELTVNGNMAAEIINNTG